MRSIRRLNFRDSMPTGSSHPSFLGHFLTGFAIVAAAAFVTVWLHQTSFLHWADLENLDAWILLHKPEPSREIVVVDITDDDYRGLFDSQSPLAPPRVRTLIWAIAATYPKVVGIDLDTSEWDPSERQWLVDKVKIGQTGVPGAVPVVWALGGYPLDDKTTPDGDTAENREGRVTLDPINGGPGPYCWAIPGIVSDQDGVVRSYMRSVADGTGRRLYGFATAIATVDSHGSAACLNPPAAPATLGQSHRIAFTGGRDAFEHLTASVVLGAAFSDAWKIDNPLRGKIVLLGGAYHLARDRYVTPVAYLDGVDVLAHSLQSLSSRNEMRDAGKELFLWIDLALGAFLVTLSYSKTLWAQVFAFVMIPLLSLVASLLIYNSLGYFASVTPVILGVTVHSLMEHFVDHHRLNREVIRLTDELHRLRDKA